MFLADAGAEVIRIEQPGGGEDRQWSLMGPDGENLVFKILARNKKGITLLPHKGNGKAVFAELVKRSDIVLHNATPGTNLAQELRYSSLGDINPGIIVANVSGYGSNGPKSGRVGLDFAIQAGVGSMVLNGLKGCPPQKTTVPYIDCCTGISCALGILIALYHREKTGLGQDVEVSLFDIGFFITQALGTLMLHEIYGERREHLGNFGFATYMSCLKAKDGLVMVVPSTNYIWARFAHAIGREDMIEDSRFGSDMDRWTNTAVIDGIVQKWANQKTVDEIIKIMGKARVACEPVRSADQLIDDPQVAAREMIVWSDYPGLGKIPLPGLPIKLSRTPGDITSLAPKVGEHNMQVYHDLLGFEPEKIQTLESEGII
jgi:crotonobetainyl-CoA:carnitine CoA-transferase CaiB-like acyl-CoA transferase